MWDQGINNLYFTLEKRFSNSLLILRVFTGWLLNESNSLPLSSCLPFPHSSLCCSLGCSLPLGSSLWLCSSYVAHRDQCELHIYYNRNGPLPLLVLLVAALVFLAFEAVGGAGVDGMVVVLSPPSEVVISWGWSSLSGAVHRVTTYKVLNR